MQPSINLHSTNYIFFDRECFVCQKFSNWTIVTVDRFFGNFLFMLLLWFLGVCFFVNTNQLSISVVSLATFLLRIIKPGISKNIHVMTALYSSTAIYSGPLLLFRPAILLISDWSTLQWLFAFHAQTIDSPTRSMNHSIFQPFNQSINHSLIPCGLALTMILENSASMSVLTTVTSQFWRFYLYGVRAVAVMPTICAVQASFKPAFTAVIVAEAP